MVDVLIVHDPREPAKKCSLTPLRGTAGLRFVAVRGGKRIDAGRRIWLHPDGETLTAADRGIGLLLIDCTWRRLPALSRRVDGELLPRRLPELVTAYPRRSKLTPDPERGLASVEALYAATALLDAARPELLRHYRWAADFLAANPDLPCLAEVPRNVPDDRGVALGALGSREPPGASGFSAGGSGAVFLPNGGIVSTGD